MLNLKLMSQGNNKKNKKTLGATLFEMLIYMALFGMVFTGIYMVFNAAVKYYYVTQANVWVQQGSLSAVNELARELAESSSNSVAIYPNTTNATAQQGIVFMSPRNSSGALTYNSTNVLYMGCPYWQKYVAYYIDIDPNDSSKKAIFRKEISVTQADYASRSGTYTTTYFAAGAGSTLPYKIVAYNITDFDIYRLNGATKTYDAPTVSNPATNPIYISITAQDNSVGKSNTITTGISTDAMNY